MIDHVHNVDSIDDNDWHRKLFYNPLVHLKQMFLFEYDMKCQKLYHMHWKISPVFVNYSHYNGITLENNAPSSDSDKNGFQTFNTTIISNIWIPIILELLVIFLQILEPLQILQMLKCQNKNGNTCTKRCNSWISWFASGELLTAPRLSHQWHIIPL